jgi:hypothetical protein
VQAIYCCGKGGNMGGDYMMAKGIELLKQQGFDGDKLNILMVGDRFDTDIAAGISAGIRTCLVASGCHQLTDQEAFPNFKPDFYASSVSDLVDSPSEAAAVAPGLEQGGAELEQEQADAELVVQSRAGAELEQEQEDAATRLTARASAASEADAAAPEGGGSAKGGGGAE